MTVLENANAKHGAHREARVARNPRARPALLPIVDACLAKRGFMMPEAKPTESRLPRIILYLAVAMIAVGVILHGLGLSTFQRIWHDLVSRPGGSLALRFVLQPTMSAIVAIRDGIKDSHTGRSPYFWTMFADPAKRRENLREGVAATGKIILLAMLLDAIYQYIELKTFYPAEALIVAILLAFIPYFLIRGPAGRIARRLQRRDADSETKRT